MTLVTAFVAFTVALGIAPVPVAGAELPPVFVSQVRDIDPGSEDGDPMQGGNESEQFGAADLDGVLVFDASVYPESGVELWRSDGTEAGTVLLKDINPGTSGPVPLSSSPAWFVKMNGEAFFTAAADSVEGTELWKTDGTETGTVLVRDINPAPVFSSTPKNLVNAGGTLFFVANSDGVNGEELWKSDGTTGGTVMVKDIESGLATPTYNFTAVGDQLFFTFNDGTNGKELWTSDGTGAGTFMVKDINPGAGSGLPGPNVNQEPSDYHAYNGQIFFRATDGGGFRLWKSDGTPGGTVEVDDIGMTGSASFEEMGGELFFASDFSLYKTDGTGPGTVQVKAGSPTDTTSSGGTLYYVRGAYQLWKSDGSDAGTEIVADLGSGPPPGGPLEALTDFNGTLYFSFDDGSAFGEELWRSDGTEVGTERVTDINPGAGDSSIGAPFVAGDNLYFRGQDDGTTGLELWRAYSDVTPPETSIDSGPAEGETIGVDSATFTFSSNEAGASFECQFDAGPPVACDTGTITYSDLAEGPHTFSVTATDQAPFSNADPSPATRSFNYTVVDPPDPPDPPEPDDTTAPVVNVTGPARQVLKGKKATVKTRISCDETCSLRVATRIQYRQKLKRKGKSKMVKRKMVLPARTISLPDGTGKAVRLKLNRKKSRNLIRLIRSKRARKPVVRVVVTGTDTAGNVSTPVRKNIKLKKPGKKKRR